LDWSIFHALNGALQGNDGGQDAAVAFNTAAIFVLVATAGLLWFVARPGGSLGPKLAAVSAAAAAALALIVNVVLGQLWYQSRPFVGHPRQTLLLVRHAADNSFPSDHAQCRFRDRVCRDDGAPSLRLFLLVVAAAIAIDRIFVGVHYPVDVVASLLIGLASAMIVTIAGRRCVRWSVERG
jgi:undecaprenyl-diphosphatase